MDYSKKRTIFKLLLLFIILAGITLNLEIYWWQEKKIQNEKSSHNKERQELEAQINSLNNDLDKLKIERNATIQ